MKLLQKTNKAVKGKVLLIVPSLFFVLFFFDINFKRSLPDIVRHNNTLDQEILVLENRLVTLQLENTLLNKEANRHLPINKYLVVEETTSNTFALLNNEER